MSDYPRQRSGPLAVSENFLASLRHFADGADAMERPPCGMDTDTPVAPREDRSPSSPKGGVAEHGRGRATGTVPVALRMKHTLVQLAIRQLLQSAEDLTATDDGPAVDVVVVDLDAGDFDVDAARAPGDGRAAPAVVGLTGNVQAEWITRVLRAGVSAVVSTVAPPEQLLRAIRTVAGGEMYFDPRVARVVVTQLRARRSPATVPAQRKQFADLSEREQIVLRLVAEGHTGPEIGRLLGITAKTVDTYRHRIQEKIGLAHRRDYIHFALRVGLLTD
jgi:DNA-binding NarL/FixJ family response regulator